MKYILKNNIDDKEISLEKINSNPSKYYIFGVDRDNAITLFPLVKSDSTDNSSGNPFYIAVRISKSSTTNIAVVHRNRSFAEILTILGIEYKNVYIFDNHEEFSEELLKKIKELK